MEIKNNQPFIMPRLILINFFITLGVSLSVFGGFFLFQGKKSSNSLTLDSLAVREIIVHGSEPSLGDPTRKEIVLTIGDGKIPGVYIYNSSNGSGISLNLNEIGPTIILHKNLLNFHIGIEEGIPRIYTWDAASNTETNLLVLDKGENRKNGGAER